MASRIITFLTLALLISSAECSRLFDSSETETGTGLSRKLSLYENEFVQNGHPEYIIQLEEPETGETSDILPSGTLLPEPIVQKLSSVIANGNFYIKLKITPRKLSHNGRRAHSGHGDKILLKISARASSKSTSFELLLNPPKRRLRLRYRSEFDGSIRQLATKIPRPRGRGGFTGTLEGLNAFKGSQKHHAVQHEISVGVRNRMEFSVYIDCSLALFGNFTPMATNWARHPDQISVAIGGNGHQSSSHVYDGSISKFRFAKFVNKQTFENCSMDHPATNIGNDNNQRNQKTESDTLAPEPSHNDNDIKGELDEPSVPVSDPKSRFDMLRQSSITDNSDTDNDQHSAEPQHGYSEVTGELAEDGHHHELSRRDDHDSHLEVVNDKLNYLVDEMKDLRHRLDHYDGKIKKLQLHQRGCHYSSDVDGDSTEGQASPFFLDNGGVYRNESTCEECSCTDGRLYCRRMGCPVMNCPHPVMETPEACCPVCKATCERGGRIYEHGETYIPKNCTTCTCDDGDIACRYHAPAEHCPSVDHCAPGKLVWPPHIPDTATISVRENLLTSAAYGGCCPVCRGDDFCHSLAFPSCSEHATCVNQKFGRKCRCKEGFFGDGVNCFDIDECHEFSVSSLAKYDSDGKIKRCGRGARCVNTPGSFKCECRPGFIKLDEFNCLDVLLYR